MRTKVIAEIGSCHEGSLSRAVRLVETAKQCGATVVKAQYWSSAERLAGRRNAPGHLSAYEAGRIPVSWLRLLAHVARDMGLQFACTTYLPEDVLAVAEHCDIMKVASFEATDSHLLAMHGDLLRLSGKHVIVSLGMGARAHEVCARVGVQCGDSHLTLMHCVSAYPAPLDDLRISALWRKCITGFSDHAPPNVTSTGALAVAAGARVVERHLRLDDTSPSNADYGHSSSPRAFEAYVENIQMAERVVGADISEGMRPCEEMLAGFRVMRRRGEC